MDQEPGQLQDQIDDYILHAQISIIRLDIIWTEYPEYRAIGEYNPEMETEFLSLFETYNTLIHELESHSEILIQVVSEIQIYNILLSRRRDEWHERDTQRHWPSNPDYIHPFRDDLLINLAHHIQIYERALRTSPRMGERDVAIYTSMMRIGREDRGDLQANVLDLYDEENRRASGMPLHPRHYNEIQEILERQRVQLGHRDVPDVPIVLPREIRPIRPPLRPHQPINPLRSGRTNSDNFACCICAEDDVNPASLDRPHLTTNCNHRYHWNCLRAWVQSRHDEPSCPMCRASIDPGFNFDQ